MQFSCSLKSASAGDPRGQTTLGVKYHRGYGIPQEYKSAAKWYTLATKQMDAVVQKNLKPIREIIFPIQKTIKVNQT